MSQTAENILKVLQDQKRKMSAGSDSLINELKEEIEDKPYVPEERHSLTKVRSRSPLELHVVTNEPLKFGTELNQQPDSSEVRKSKPLTRKKGHFNSIAADYSDQIYEDPK